MFKFTIAVACIIVAGGRRVERAGTNKQSSHKLWWPSQTTSPPFAERFDNIASVLLAFLPHVAVNSPNRWRGLQTADQLPQIVSYRRNTPVIAGAVLERRSTLQFDHPPPAPPQPPNSRGGGGGGGDDSAESLHILGDGEQALVLDDWMARTKIYSTDGMSSAAFATKHRKLLETLQEIRDFVRLPSNQGGRRMVCGLYRDKQVRVLASVEVSQAEGLSVFRIAPHPSEANDDDSCMLSRMRDGLRELAKAIDVASNMNRHHAKGSAESTDSSVNGVGSGLSGE
jgi:hypothetical protein